MGKNNPSPNDRAFVRLWWLVVIGGGLLMVIMIVSYLSAISGDLALWANDGIPVPAPTRSVVKTSLSLREIWRKTPIYKSSNTLGIVSSWILNATPDSVYVNTHRPTTSVATVLALDAKTGDQRWATKPQPVHSLAVGPNALYVAAQTGIRAYDLKTGTLKWTSDQPSADHTRYYVYFVDSQLQLFIPGPDQFKFIDVNSGKVSPPQDLGALVALDGQDRYLCDEEKFQLQDSTTRRGRWTVSISRINPCYPRRIGNVVLIPMVRAESRRWHTVLAVAYDSGRTLWTCQDCFASDVAVEGGWFYALTKEGALARYDVSTGKLLGTVEFSGGAKPDPNGQQYAIAAAGGRVFVHFGDSQELIAFGP
jgi:outer membrane protein assembly factor BamB